MIKIFTPQIIETTTGARLQAEFEVDGDKNVLWYEVEKKYAEYLTNERADAFVVGLLWYALKHQHDIQVLSPMSERLYYTINKYLTPLMAEVRGYKTIRLFCEELASEPIPNANAVGAGFIGSHKDFGGEVAFRVFKKRLEIVKACADELGKELITVDSNLSDFLQMGFGPTNTQRTISAVLTLQKLFKNYYHSSAIHLKDFELSLDPSGYDIFNLNMLSTENTSLFSSCTNYTRVDKTRMVAEFEPSYKYLNVCEMGVFNCGKCSKCLRTLLTLEIIGALDKYKSIFNVKAYLERRSNYIARVKANHQKDTYSREIYNEMIRTKFL